MLVVSALKTTSHCESIRICERPAIRKVVKKNSEIPKLKKVTNMDVSLAKLKIALMELRDQDKNIYKQFITLNKNIQRLKEDIRKEEDKRKEYDDDFQSESETESEAESEVEEISEYQLGLPSYRKLSPIGSTNNEVKEVDENSNHERYDSGIMEDDQYMYKDESPYRPPSREMEFDGQPFNKPNSPLSPISKAEATENHEPRPKTESLFQSEPRSPTEPRLMNERQFQIKTANGVSKENPKLQRRQTLHTVKIQMGRRLNFHKHRRSLSEDHNRVNNSDSPNRNIGIVNAAFISTPNAKSKEPIRGNLGQISETSGCWSKEDVQRHANTSARKLYRHKIPRENNFNIINSANSRVRDETESAHKLMNSSLSQLNLQGAISSGTIKAIQRSASVANCSTVGKLTTNQRPDNFLSDSLNIRRREPNDRMACRRTKSSGGLIKCRSGFINSNLEFQRTFSTRDLDTFRPHGNGMEKVERMSSTISLV